MNPDSKVLLYWKIPKLSITNKFFVGEDVGGFSTIIEITLDWRDYNS
jgi:hypothetical protein